jgi:hypothetical protein
MFANPRKSTLTVPYITRPESPTTIMTLNCPDTQRNAKERENFLASALLWIRQSTLIHANPNENLVASALLWIRQSTPINANQR